MPGSTAQPKRTKDEADDSENPCNLAEWTEFHQQVDALPEDEREVFNLLWYGELTQAEAAEILGIAVRTVIRRWQAAREFTPVMKEKPLASRLLSSFQPRNSTGEWQEPITPWSTFRWPPGDDEPDQPSFHGSQLPLHIREVNEFVARYHRHSLPTVGGKFPFPIVSTQYASWPTTNFRPAPA